MDSIAKYFVMLHQLINDNRKKEMVEKGMVVVEEEEKVEWRA